MISQLRCMYTNANSLVNKMEELRLRIEHSQYDIVAVTETWAHRSVTDSELNVRGYVQFRKDRQGRGGGVILYVRDFLDVMECADLNNSDFQESIWCRINTDQQSLLVGVCYRCPTSPVDNNNNLLKLLAGAVQAAGTSHLLIMGDFNYPEINYEDDWVSSGLDSDPGRFFLATQDLFLTQHVSEPTRFRQGNQPSTLDYIFTSEEEVIEKINYETPIGKSDHAVLSWDLTVAVKTTMTRTSKLNFWRGNYVAINEALKKVNWELEFAGLQAEGMWQVFRNTLLRLINDFVPCRTEKKRGRNRWISKSTVRQIKVRNRAWNDYKKSRCDGDYKKYTKIRNKVNGLVREDKSKHIDRLFKSFRGNPKRFYGFMRDIKTVKAEVRDLVTPNGTRTENDQQAAQVLCDYFKKVFTLEPDDSSHSAPPMSRNGITVDFEAGKVYQRLVKLKSDKSAGSDGLHPFILKACSESIAQPLSQIFQASYDEGKVPSDWKKAEITPIYKKGPRSTLDNYRPVSLTSVPCKIMEGMIRDSLLKYLEETDQISSRQHGFLRGRSCLTNLLETFEAWTAALDEGYGTDVIYLDFRKAFDTVPHVRLVQKLAGLGVGGQLLQWIRDFLASRTMRVNVKGSYSCWAEVDSGVPQGSVLGPLLFLVYVNDIPDWIKNSIRMFADDTKIWARVSELRDAEGLQADLDQLQKWSDTWLLRFNASKCKVMHLGHKLDTRYFLQENGQRTELQQVQEEKDLGVLVSHDMKPTKQCVEAAKKARSVLGMISRQFPKLSKEQFLVVYKAYVRPHLEYCVQAWAPWLRKDIDCLERIQRRATKLVSGFKSLSYEQRLDRLHLTTLEARRHRGDLIQAFRILMGKDQVEWQQFFQLNSNPHDLRGHSMKLYIPGVRTTLRKNFFSYRLLHDWNRLPQEVIDADTVLTFKKRLEEFNQIWD